MRTTRADRRQSINNYKHWVYGLYLDNSLVYVGVTADPAQRVQSHAQRKVFDEIRLIKGFSNRDKAEEFEKFAIIDLQPPLNILKLETSFNPSKISRKDYERFFNGTPAQEYDFSLLDNEGIRRRIAWQERVST